MDGMTTREPSLEFTGYDGVGTSPSGWDSDDENSPVFAVVSAVADASGTDVFDLPPLAETIDPEALNDLFLSGRETPELTVAFEYVGYEVVVSGDGTVRVE